MMKNLSIYISEYFFLGLASLKKVKQSIKCNISSYMMIIDLKVVLLEFFGPSRLDKNSSF